MGTAFDGARQLRGLFAAYLKDKGVPNIIVRLENDAATIQARITRQGNQGLLRGVILMPHMRQYGDSGYALTLQTYEGEIDQLVIKLTEQLNIPLVQIKTPSNKQLLAGLKRISNSKV